MEKLTRINTVLLAILSVLVIILITGTIIGLVRNNDTPLSSSGKTDTQSIIEETVFNNDIRVFSGIGRLRITLANNSVLILSIAFPYQENDIAFTEELAGKINEFKTIAIDYFSSLPETEIMRIDEDAAKTEILNRYNNTLSLGRISVLYFNDLILLDAN